MTFCNFCFFFFLRFSTILIQFLFDFNFHSNIKKKPVKETQKREAVISVSLRQMEVWAVARLMKIWQLFLPNLISSVGQQQLLHKTKPFHICSDVLVDLQPRIKNVCVRVKYELSGECETVIRVLFIFPVVKSFPFEQRLQSHSEEWNEEQSAL